LRPGDLRAKFKRWDKNKDGLWTIEEAEMAIEGNFRWLDKNKSKSISIDEMPPKF
jgi:Ca2+-binding EF-hand superfamily protein